MPPEALPGGWGFTSHPFNDRPMKRKDKDYRRPAEVAFNDINAWLEETYNMTVSAIARTNPYIVLKKHVCTEETALLDRELGVFGANRRTKNHKFYK